MALAGWLPHPLGGPTARAASALQIDSAEIFLPMVPAMLTCCAFVVWAAYRLGVGERRRLADAAATHGAVPAATEGEGLTDARADDPDRTPRNLWLNATLTVALMVALVAGVLPLPVLFMIAFAVALVLNFPSVGEQKALLSRHAGNVLIPFTFFISNDAFYYGVLPILAKAGEAYGITAAEMGRAAIIGQPVHLLSPLVPSTYLLVGLVGIEFGDHQRFTLKWCLLTSLVMLAAGIATAVIPWVGRAAL